MGRLSDRFQQFNINDATSQFNPTLENCARFFIYLFIFEVCWKNETEKPTALWSVRCSWRWGGGTVTIAMNTENEACSLVHWREFLPPPFTLSLLPSLIYKEGTVRPLFITKQSLHCNLGGVQLRKLLASAEACFH